MKSRRGGTDIAVRVVNGTGQKGWDRKAGCCRGLGNAPKTLDRCIRPQGAGVIRGKRWLLGVMAGGVGEEDGHSRTKS